MRSNIRSIWAQLEEDKDIFFFFLADAETANQRIIQLLRLM